MAGENPFAKEKSLEGFGFLDLLQMKDDMQPRATELCASAIKWLKVANDARLINILGTGLGDILKNATQEWPSTKSVPCGSDVLAAPVSIIARIATERCSSTENGFGLAHQVIWNEPLRAFGHPLCRC